MFGAAIRAAGAAAMGAFMGAIVAWTLPKLVDFANAPSDSLYVEVMTATQDWIITISLLGALTAFFVRAVVERQLGVAR